MRRVIIAGLVAISIVVAIWAFPAPPPDAAAPDLVTNDAPETQSEPVQTTRQFGGDDTTKVETGVTYINGTMELACYVSSGPGGTSYLCPWGENAPGASNHQETIPVPSGLAGAIIEMETEYNESLITGLRDTDTHYDDYLMHQEWEDRLIWRFDERFDEYDAVELSLYGRDEAEGALPWPVGVAFGIEVSYLATYFHGTLPDNFEDYCGLCED